MIQDKIQDTHSLEWLRVRDYCKKRIRDLHLDNDSPLNIVDTSKNRGMIAFAKEVLSLGEKDGIAAIADTEYIE